LAVFGAVIFAFAFGFAPVRVNGAFGRGGSVLNPIALRPVRCSSKSGWCSTTTGTSVATAGAGVPVTTPGVVGAAFAEALACLALGVVLACLRPRLRRERPPALGVAFDRERTCRLMTSFVAVRFLAIRGGAWGGRVEGGAPPPRRLAKI
jgi:hypothetical protein